MNSHWLRVIGYVVLVVLCLVARWREQGRADEGDGVWRPFWLVTAGFLAAMAIARAGDIGHLLSDLGRGQAGGGGWYDIRRPIQGAVLAALGAAWLISVALALLQTWERLRRYLPMGMMVATLAAYAAVRLVSLHQVDVLLYRRDIAGVRVGILIEAALLVVTGLITLWVPFGEPEEPEYAPSRSA